jgi:hypothetical protein
MPVGVSAAEVWAQAEKDARPKRRSLLEDALEPQSHALPPLPLPPADGPVKGVDTLCRPSVRARQSILTEFWRTMMFRNNTTATVADATVDTARYQHTDDLVRLPHRVKLRRVNPSMPRIPAGGSAKLYRIVP